MKVCITATGQDLKANIDPRFGRCQYLLFVDSETENILEVKKNENIDEQKGVGITTAQVVADSQAQAVITGNIGPNAVRVLSQAGIKIYSVDPEMSVTQALKKLKTNQLSLVS